MIHLLLVGVRLEGLVGILIGETVVEVVVVLVRQIECAIRVSHHEFEVVVGGPLVGDAVDNILLDRGFRIRHQGQ